MLMEFGFQAELSSNGNSEIIAVYKIFHIDERGNRNTVRKPSYQAILLNRKDAQMGMMGNRFLSESAFQEGALELLKNEKLLISKIASHVRDTLHMMLLNVRSSNSSEDIQSMIKSANEKGLDGAVFLDMTQKEWVEITQS